MPTSGFRTQAAKGTDDNGSKYEPTNVMSQRQSKDMDLNKVLCF